MKKYYIYLSLFVLLGACQLQAANIVTQTITFSVDPIAEIDVTGDPPPLVVTSVPAGSAPSVVSDNSTSYSITTNGNSQKITVSLNAPMPTGTMLCVMATPPDGASCTCVDGLDTSDQVMVTGISQVAQANLQISYHFKSDATAGIIPQTTRIVKFTLGP